MESKTGRVSELCLERYALGELSAAEREAVDRARAGDPSIDERLREIEASNQDILAAYRPEFMARAIEAKAAGQGGPSGRSRRTILLGFPAGIAAALLVAFFALPRLGGPSAEAAWSGRDSTRAKGGTPQLLVYRNAPGGPESLKAGMVAASHDVLQLAYEAGEGGFGAILSIDGRGSITYHLPEAYGGGALKAPALSVPGRAYLPRAFELDDAPGFERFFFVSSPKAFELSTLEAAAKALAAGPGKAKTGDLGLPRGFRQISFLIQKRGEQ